MVFSPVDDKWLSVFLLFMLFRSKRYALQGSRWKVKALTYRISKYPKRLSRQDVDDEIAKAFAVWSEYTDLTFTSKKTNPVHIDIR